MERSEQKKVFFRRNLIGGFNKSDVVAYIARQNQDQISELDDLRADLSASEQAHRRTKEQIVSLSTALTHANQELAQARSEADALREALAQANARIDALDAAKADMDARFQTIFSGLRSAADDLCTVPLPTADDAQIDALNSRIDALTAENRELHTALEKLSGFQAAMRSLLGNLSDVTAPSDATPEQDV